MAKDARRRIRETKQALRKLLPKNKYIDTLRKVSLARARAWAKAKARHEKKMSFLVAKLGSCCSLHTQERDWARIRARDKKVTRGSCSSSVPLAGADQRLLLSKQPPNGIDPLLAGTSVSMVRITM